MCTHKECKSIFNLETKCKYAHYIDKRKIATDLIKNTKKQIKEKFNEIQQNINKQNYKKLSNKYKQERIEQQK